MEELAARGEEATAVDLPIEDREATFFDYAAAVPDGDVLVGHSMGGITASLVAAERGCPVIYVAALLPQEGRPLADCFGEMMCDGVAEAMERRADGLRWWREGEAERFGLDPAHLRGQAVTPYFDALPAAAPGRYVVCTRDRVVSPAWGCLLYTSPSPRDGLLSRMPSSA